MVCCLKNKKEVKKKMKEIVVELRSAVSRYIAAKNNTDGKKSETMKAVVERAVNFLDNGGSSDSLYKILENKN